MKKILFSLILTLLFAVLVNAQGEFSYNAQKKFIPKELGKIYLGMPFDKFAKEIDLKDAEVGDTRFDWILLTIPFEKGNVGGLTVKVHGLTPEDKKAILERVTVKKKDEDGYEYEQETDKLLIEKIPAKGFVYAMYVDFREEFDLKSHVIKTYGSDGEVRLADDEYHFFDIQWTKKTSDGLLWLIRSFHEGDTRTLQLLGRIDGTEWGID